MAKLSIEEAHNQWLLNAPIYFEEGQEAIDAKQAAIVMEQSWRSFLTTMAKNDMVEVDNQATAPSWNGVVQSQESIQRAALEDEDKQDHHIKNKLRNMMLLGSLGVGIHQIAKLANAGASGKVRAQIKKLAEKIDRKNLTQEQVLLALEGAVQEFNQRKAAGDSLTEMAGMMAALDVSENLDTEALMRLHVDSNPTDGSGHKAQISSAPSM